MTLLTHRLQLFPYSTTVTPTGLAIRGCAIAELAAKFDTPLYVYDQATLDTNVAAYRSALGSAYPGPTAITLAGKAFLSTAVVQWAQLHDLWLDCTGAGEIHIATTAGYAPDRLLVHGVNKSRKDLETAFDQTAVIVVDNLTELARIRQLAATGGAARIPELWLRMRPGFTVDTHAYRQTGQADSKFGMDRREISQAVAACLADGLPLTGLHFHLGSDFHDPAPLAPAIENVLDLSAGLQAAHGWTPATLCPGGGWGVAYHEEELPSPPLEEYVIFVAKTIVQATQQRRLPLPILHLEPGRSLVAQAGVAVYRIGTVKESAYRRWYLVDGGMADNPRPALYGARYSALPVAEPRRPYASSVSIAGPYCESGDILIDQIQLPDLTEDELLAIPVSGAYHLAMGSNYNGARKPAVVWIRAQKAHLVQRRDRLQDLSARDVPLPNP